MWPGMTVRAALCTLFLLHFPALGNAQQSEWLQRKTTTGCLFTLFDNRNTFFDILEWTGPCTPGQPLNGPGTLTMSVSEATKQTPPKVEGTFFNGVLDGDLKINGKPLKAVQGCFVGDKGMTTGCTPGTAPTTASGLTALPIAYEAPFRARNRCVKAVAAFGQRFSDKKHIINRSGERFKKYTVNQVNQHYVATIQYQLRLYTEMPSCAAYPQGRQSLEKSLHKEQADCRRFNTPQCDTGIYHLPDKADVEATIQRIVAEDRAKPQLAPRGTGTPNTAARQSPPSAAATTQSPQPGQTSGGWKTAQAPAAKDKKATAASGGSTKGCLSLIDEPGSYGGFKNSCDHDIELTYCIANFVVKPGAFNWGDAFACEKGKFGRVSVKAKGRSGNHTKGGRVFYVACKAPMGPTQVSYEKGRLAGNCK